MSSGTNAEMNPINGVKPMADVIETSVIESNQQVTTMLKEGLKSIIEFQDYLGLLTKMNEFQPIYLEPLMKTVDPEILNNIGKSQEFGKVLKQILEQAANAWSEESLLAILKALEYIPFDVDVLIKNSLGFGVKDVKKTAITKANAQLVSITSTIIDKWKNLHKRTTLNANGKRDSPDRSSDSPPSLSPTGPEPAKKPFRLAIQKDPPARPRAIADPNFFSSLRETKKYPSTRPIYHVDRILEDLNTKTDKTEKGTAASMLNAGPSYPNALHSSTPTTPAVEEAAITSVNPSSSNRRRVRFKDNLVEIREYEKNPEEWRSFDEIDDKGNPLDINANKSPNRIPQIAWYPPQEVKFDIEANQNLVLPKAIRSPEAVAQEKREKTALAAIYTSPQHIPPSPAEPDEVPNPNADGTVPQIPLVDTEYPVITPSDPSPPPPKVVNQNMMTPENLSAAAAIAAAILPQHQQQAYTQSTLTPPSLPTPTASNYYTPPHTSAYTHRVSAPAPTPTPAPAPTAIPTAPAAQPGLSNQTVEAMLKNNPGIMQSLKQLSFLAAGNGLSTTQYHPEPQPQPQVNYQQPYMQQQYQPPAQNDWNRGNLNRNNEPKRGRKSGKGPKGGQGNIGRGRGRGGNIGGGGPIRSYENRNSTRCSFFRSPEGCRNGDQCHFSHE